ncbi:hypothetical protein [uncultured Clostridium sp.]|uniref:hypothetical protein n=1 Tax=uncultured Clostridium sp. TaxID=59620 RepID=UPI002635FB86|nr:hypothetical protein [uncultured Clostridium sp.]
MLFDSKRRHKKRIEKRAIKELGVIKTKEDHYYIPANRAEANGIDISFKKNEMYKDAELIDSIKNMQIKNSENIFLFFKDILDDGTKVIQASIIEQDSYENIVNDYEICKFYINSELLEPDRNDLVNMIAYFLRDKNVTITFIVLYDFKMLDEYFTHKC